MEDWRPISQGDRGGVPPNKCHPVRTEMKPPGQGHWLNSLESIRDVHFDEVDEPEARIGAYQALQNALQGMTKLHCFVWSQGDSLIINTKETEVCVGGLHRLG